MRGICESCRSLNSVGLSSKAFELTNRKFVFLLLTECIFVNDGGELRFVQEKISLFSFVEADKNLSMSTHEFKKVLGLVS